jgi:RNA polymerase sigma-70 factor (ECF subfamily)
MDHELSLSREHVSAERVESSEYDAVLARRIVDGDLDAWDRFFDRFSTWAYRFAYYHLNRNHADAEDLCSDILVTAARSMHTYNPSRGSLDLWLLGVARHRLSLFYRRRGAEQPYTPEVVESQGQAGVQDLGRLADRIVAQEAVNRALAELPERQASALIGKYVEGYSTEELARIENTTPKAMESLLTRARSSFRSIVCELLGIEGRGR